MSLTRRIWEGAQTGVSKLAQLVIVDDEPLSHVDSGLLRTELESRRAAREQAPRKASDNPIANMASSTPAAHAERQRLGKERSARVSRDRDTRAQAQKAQDLDPKPGKRIRRKLPEEMIAEERDLFASMLPGLQEPAD